jgi:hypothetical protein
MQKRQMHSMQPCKRELHEVWIWHRHDNNHYTMSLASHTITKFCVELKEKGWIWIDHQHLIQLKGQPDAHSSRLHRVQKKGSTTLSLMYTSFSCISSRGYFQDLNPSTKHRYIAKLTDTRWIRIGYEYISNTPWIRIQWVSKNKINKTYMILGLVRIWWIHPISGYVLAQLGQRPSPRRWYTLSLFTLPLPIPTLWPSHL